MSSNAPRLATYEDLLRLPEDVRAEIIAGQVHTARIKPFDEIELEVGALFPPIGRV